MSETIQKNDDDFDWQKSKVESLQYYIREHDFCGFISEHLMIKTDDMIIDCETGFTQFKIPFEDDEAICWDCGKQRNILVYLHGWKSRSCHFSECCER